MKAFSLKVLFVFSCIFMVSLSHAAPAQELEQQVLLNKKTSFSQIFDLGEKQLNPQLRIDGADFLFANDAGLVKGTLTVFANGQRFSVKFDACSAKDQPENVLNCYRDGDGGSIRVKVSRHVVGFLVLSLDLSQAPELAERSTCKYDDDTQVETCDSTFTLNEAEKKSLSFLREYREDVID